MDSLSPSRLTTAAPISSHRTASPAPVASHAPASPRDSVSPSLTSSRIHGALSAYAGAETTGIRAGEVRTTNDYVQFLQGLEQKYPGASGLDLNRAVRQHFYSDEGSKNSSPVFDSWLGKDGGKNSPSLQGIEKDLQGLPTRLANPEGKQVDLSHVSVGIDAYYNQKTGRNGALEATLDAAKGFMLTHGGDLGQVFGGLIRAIPGVGDKDETVGRALAYASPDQLRGNQAGLSIGSDMTPQTKLSSAVQGYFQK